MPNSHIVHFKQFISQPHRSGCTDAAVHAWLSCRRRSQPTQQTSGLGLNDTACLHVLFIVHTIVDGYALHCRRCKVMYSLCCGQTAMPFGKTGGTAPGFRQRLHRWSETTSFRFFFRELPRSVAIHTFTHDVRRI